MTRPHVLIDSRRPFGGGALVSQSDPWQTLGLVETKGRKGSGDKSQDSLIP